MALLVGSGTSLGGLTGGAAVARLLIVVSGNTSGLYTSLSAATKSLEGFKQNAGAVGSALTRTLTLPLLALGGYAIKAASDFQSALARIAGLTPILDDTKKSIEEIGTELLDMSVRTGTSAVALADALYYAGSAGLDASVAMKVVELSAKGAAIGMGDAADISRVLIFALNNYEEEGLTAAAAMDTLTVAIREGTAEPAELAIALGRVIPVAKAAGISFGQLVGSVAALTNLGVPTRVATTSLRALFGQLLAPTIQATELLDQLGITAEELRTRMDMAGPIGAFDLLTEATKGNFDALHDIIPQIRAFSAFLGLTQDEAVRLTEIYLKAANATGQFNKAFKQIEVTPAFKFQVALQKLNRAAIEFGSKAMPVFLELVDILGEFGDMLSNLPDPIQKLVLVFAGLLAVTGPALKIFDALTNAGQGLFTNFRSGIAGVAALGFAIGLTVANFQSMLDVGGNLLNTMGVLAGSFITAKLAITGLQRIASLSIFATNGLATAISGLSGGMVSLVAVGIAAAVAGIGLFITQGRKLQSEMNQLSESATEIATAGGSVREFIEGLDNKEAAATLRDIAKNLDLMNKPLGDSVDLLVRGSGGLGDQFVGTLRGLSDGLREANRAAEAVEIEKFIGPIEQALASGRNISAVAKEAGLDVSELFRILGDTRTTTAAGTASHNLGEIAENARELGLEIGHIEEGFRNFNVTQRDSIAGIQANDEAISQLARKYGVSEETIRSSIDRYLGGIALMDDRTEEEWSHAAKLVDDKGNLIGAAAEKAAARMAIAAEAVKSLRDEFTLFGELPEQFAKPMDKLLGRANQLARVQVTQISNMRTLFERGLPLGLIQDIQKQGPNALQRFANASDRELRKLRIAYQVGLGAMDEEILAEVAHQEQKGASMVERFTTSILRRKMLPAEAARQIVFLMTDAFARGDMTQAGFEVVESFLNAVTASGLPKKAAGRITLAFAQRIASGQGIPPLGTKAGQQFATNLAKAGNITKQAAGQLILRAGEGVREKKPQLSASANEAAHTLGDALDSPEARTAAFDAGYAMMREFASGIIAGLFAPLTAVDTAVNDIRNKFDNNLKGSPKYFTYYTGKELVKQLGEGMASMPSSYPQKQLSRVLHHPTGRIQSASRAPRRVNFDLDVRIDRRRHARNVDYELVSRGL